GSGVIVEKDKVLTNCHVLRDTGKPWVSRGEDSYIIESVQADRWHDLCLVTTSGLPGDPAVIASDLTLKRGQEAVAIGHSSGSPAPLTSMGSIQSLYPLDGGDVIRSTAGFSLGASGSGLYDGEGHLIGINTFKTIGRKAYYYALPIKWLDAVKALPVETQFPIKGEAFWEAEKDKKPYFMQVAVPQLNKDWPTLAEIAQHWTEAQPNSTEAWYELGVAQENLGQQAQAENSYRKSVTLDPLNTDSLYRIGVIASKKGDKDEMHAINLSILDIDKDLAAEFSKEVGCNGAC
ncbi:MAG TPA: trypsin-like peptidase domain-containing protein, partial [Methylophilaceae bacterium]|nr:trypsin-like peptidase domain-containing protein [Methylophilaceae bacterium]